MVMPTVETARNFSASGGAGRPSVPTPGPSFAPPSREGPRVGGEVAPPATGRIKPLRKDEAAPSAPGWAKSFRRDEAKPQQGAGKGSQADLSASLQQQLEAAEASLDAARRQLEAEVEARCRAEQLRAEAVRRVEEMELDRLDLQAKLQRAASGAAGSASSSDPACEQRTAELEALLKEAIVRGAQLGRSHADAEGARAIAERRLTRVRALARKKLHAERRRADAAIERAERAEERLTEYLEAGMQGMDALVEAHVQHLVSVGHSLAQKVEEQTDIIEVLRGLLQDHKDFIRQELGDAGPAQGPPPPPRQAAPARAPVAPPAAVAAPCPAPDALPPKRNSALARLPPPPTDYKEDLPRNDGGDESSSDGEEEFLLDML